jgi:hypothetical protein
MTDAQQADTSKLNEYETLKYDSILSEDLRERWIKADQAAAWLPYHWNKLIADEDLTSAAKARRAQEVYDTHAPKVEAARKALRQDVLRAAERAEKASVPKPKGVSLEPSAVDELLVAQNETFRLHRNIEKRQSSKGPLPFDVPDYLKEQYQKGVEQGGVAGVALCRGALMLSEDLGLDDSWLPREDKHLEALDRARRLHHLAIAIPTSASSIPRALQPPRTLSRRPERRRDAGVAFLASPSQPLLKKEDASATTPQKRARQKDSASKRKKAWK